MCDILDRQRRDERHHYIIRGELFITIAGPGYQAIIGPRNTLLRYTENRLTVVGTWNHKNIKIREHQLKNRSQTHRFRMLASKIKNGCRRVSQNHHGTVTQPELIALPPGKPGQGV